MQHTVPPPLSSPGRGASGDNLDELLRAFYRQQMPNPWPRMSAPVASEEGQILRLRRAPRRKRSAQTRSRLALAASIALLFLAPWLLSDSFESRKSTADANVPVKATKPAPDLVGEGVATDDALEIRNRRIRGGIYQMDVKQKQPVKNDNVRETINKHIP